MPYVTDTHSIVWYMTGDSNLSSEARNCFHKVESGEDLVFIPCIVFFELLYLTEKKKIPVDLSIMISMVSSSRNYRVEPLCLPVIEKSRTIAREEISDPWDRLIAATSLHLAFPLITRDKSFQKAGLKVIW